jgi:hypothetical protein
VPREEAKITFFSSGVIGRAATVVVIYVSPVNKPLKQRLQRFSSEALTQLLRETNTVLRQTDRKLTPESRLQMKNPRHLR